MSETPPSGGLAGETSVSEVAEDRLCYRGYAIGDLAATCHFEEVAHLLIYGALPTSAQLAQFREMLATFRTLPGEVRDALRTIPTNLPIMEVLRTAVSMSGHFDPVEGEQPDDLRRRAVWLTAIVATVIAARTRIVQHKLPLDPKPGLSHAAQILYQIRGEVPPEPSARLLDLALVLYAEHGFNAATFTNRIICSTASDQVSAVVGAIGSVKGRLLGGGAAEVMEMLRGFESSEQAVRELERSSATERGVCGFGHQIYRADDPRVALLESALRESAVAAGKSSGLEVYDAVKEHLAGGDRPLWPNVDYPFGLTCHFLGLPPRLCAPLTVASRVTGWSAHYLEQRSHPTIIRPRSRYIGPAVREIVPLARR